MEVDYVKGLAVGIEARACMESSEQAQRKLSAKSNFPHFEIMFFNLDYELSLCQVN